MSDQFVMVAHPNLLKSLEGTSTGKLLQFFAFGHLPEPLRSTSQLFAELAFTLAASLPPSAETTVALRKLLEAKDAAVRSMLPERSLQSIFDPPNPVPPHAQASTAQRGTATATDR